MSYTSAIIQGIIQGLTEFLPVSSSGHLSVYQYLTGINSETSQFFSVLLHLGTVIAIVVAYFRELIGLFLEFLGIFKDLFHKNLFGVKPTPQRRMLYLFIVSCLPLLVFLPFKDLVEGLSSDNSILLEGICFLITAALLMISCKCPKGKKNAVNMTVKDAAIIGVAQGIATLPGISRSGATISTGLMRKLERSYAVGYSFILGLPTILAAGVLELKDAAETGGFDIPVGVALVGMAVSAVVGILAIRLINYLVTSDHFNIFAWYTLILGIVVIVIAIVEKNTDHAVQQAVMSLIN